MTTSDGARAGELAGQGKFGVRNHFLFLISAILLVDPVIAAAALGAQAVVWWSVLSLAFMLPFVLITAELSTAYPERGGLYAWVRRAFGARWGSRVSWAYWANVAIWNPAMYVLFIEILRQAFVPGLSFEAGVAIALALTWCCVIVNVVSVDVAQSVQNVGAIARIGIFVVIGAAGAYHFATYGSATSFTLESLTPRWDEDIQYLPAVVYGMLGFELAASRSDEIRNPARTVPIALYLAAFVLGTFYIVGAASFLVAMPPESLTTTNGLVGSLDALLGGVPYGDWIAPALVVATLYGLFTIAVTWVMGTNRSAAEAARQGELPKLFAREHRRFGTPLGAALLHGIASTIVIGAYATLGEARSDLFWALFAFSAAIFLVPYTAMIAAYLKLRLRDPATPRPARVPGGRLGAWMAAVACAGLLLTCLVLTLIVPGDGVQWATLAGAAAVFGLGEFLIRTAERKRTEGACIDREQAAARAMPVDTRAG